MKRALPFFLLILIACSDDDVFRNDVALRIVNRSNLDFDKVLVSSGGPQEDFGSLEAGETSEYRRFDSIYRYGYVLVEANGKQYVLQPIDYVGEEKYKKGNFSYLLDISDPENQWSVSLQFRED